MARAASRVVLSPAVTVTVRALGLGDEHAALVALARLLAATIDGMDVETRARMLGQTGGLLRGVLADLHKRADVASEASGGSGGTSGMGPGGLGAQGAPQEGARAIVDELRDRRGRRAREAAHSG